MTNDLRGRTLFITGASRGIGLAMAVAAGSRGANVAIAAKTADPHRYLPGTVYSAAEAVEDAGGQALPLIMDVRDEAQVRDAIDQTAARFGGIDFCVNNASAIDHAGVMDTDMKRFDLVHDIVVRGGFVVAKHCLPHLLQAPNPHILMLAPYPALDPERLGRALHQTMAKYSVSMQVIGMARAFRDQGVAVNGLWPRAWIATAAIEFRRGAEALAHCRTPQIMADAAMAILTRPSRDFTGQFVLDDEALYAAGERDFDKYRVDPSRPLWRSDWGRPEDPLAALFGEVIPPPGAMGQNFKPG